MGRDFICILENQFVWINSIRQGECGAQVSLELRNLLDQRKQKRIHCFLVCLALLRQLVLLLLCVKDFSLLVLGFPHLLLLEVGVDQCSGDLDARDVHFGVGGDAELLVSSTQRHSVQSQRTGDEEESAVQLLEEDHTLPTVASGQQDQDCSRGDGLAQFPPVLREGLDAVTPQLTAHVFCGVITGHLAAFYCTGASIFISADRFGDCVGIFLFLDFDFLLPDFLFNLRHRSFSLPLVHGSASGHGRSGVAADAPDQHRVTAGMSPGNLLLIALSHLQLEKKDRHPGI